MDKRRKRINFYKKLIIVVFIISILIPMIICVILLRKVNQLEDRIDKLTVQQEASAKEKPKLDPVLVYASEMETTVDMQEQNQIDSPEGDQQETRKKVYLTFDDGPSPYTNEILDVLKQYDIKATFFVVGKSDATSVAAYQRIVDEGHTLGMHSYSHVYQEIYASPEAFVEDMEKLQSYLYSLTGISAKYYRFPGGSSNTISKVRMQEFIRCLHERGIEYYDWNVTNGDAEGRLPSEQDMVNYVMRDVTLFDNSVILMHDSGDKHRTVEVLPTIIEKLIELDYEILPIDETVPPVQHVKEEGN